MARAAHPCEPSMLIPLLSSTTPGSPSTPCCPKWLTILPPATGEGRRPLFASKPPLTRRSALLRRTASSDSFLALATSILARSLSTTALRSAATRAASASRARCSASALALALRAAMASAFAFCSAAFASSILRWFSRSAASASAFLRARASAFLRAASASSAFFFASAMAR